jgi:pimeloyl-ACP methyl ester carboxylesterase
VKIIKTKSFELAIISSGDIKADKLAIVLPGRLDTKDYAPFPSHLKYLSDKGFFAISFDPPGTWDSPGVIDLFNTTSYIKAVNELIEYFGNKPTFLMGHSRGGTVSILAGASNQYVKAFAPVMATYGEPSPPDSSTQKTGIKISHRDLPPGTIKTTAQKEFALPLNYFIDGQKYNVVDNLIECSKPKLILYGTNDSFTTVEEVKSAYKIIPEPKMIYELSTEHDYRYHPNIIQEVNEAVGKFLDKFSIQ